MNEIHWQIPPSVILHLDKVPRNRAVVVLLRHSVRGHLPAGDVGYSLPITERGRELALELGALMGEKLLTLHASPLLRCIQTAEALGAGAGVEVPIIPNTLLGDPGVFVLDGHTAFSNWEALGHEGVMRELVSTSSALPAMARPDEAARFLVLAMLASAAHRPGLHVFVTHDSLVTATAARLLGRPLSKRDWPWYLEGVFFWNEDDGVCTVYRDNEGMRPGPLCSLGEIEVLELARREIAATVGLNTGARFFLAGGAFKSLLTGMPPRDLDLWAPSEHDRILLLEALKSRGASALPQRAYSDVFELGDRVIELPHKTEPARLEERLARFDLGLSAVGVEHRPGNQWNAMVHPLAVESVRRHEVLLLKPLVNWKHALTTLERMRRYAQELDYAIPQEEEAEIWRVFDTQEHEGKQGMVERYERSGFGGFGVREELACRFP